MPEEKKKGIHVKVVDLETGKELFSQELVPGLAYCCSCTTAPGCIPGCLPGCLPGCIRT